jgi:hypothetical protein
MNDYDILKSNSEIIKELFHWTAAQVHVILRLDEQDGITGYASLSEKGAESPLTYVDLILVSQPIQNQEAHVVAAEPISASRISETGDQFHNSDPLACSS